MQERAVALRLLRIEAELFVEVIEADRFEIVEAADREATAHRAQRHRHRRQVSARGMPGDVEPVRVAAIIAGMLGEYGGDPDRLYVDAVHPRRRRQRVFDER